MRRSIALSVFLLAVGCFEDEVPSGGGQLEECMSRCPPGTYPGCIDECFEFPDVDAGTTGSSHRDAGIDDPYEPPGQPVDASVPCGDPGSSSRVAPCIPPGSPVDASVPGDPPPGSPVDASVHDPYAR